MSKENPTMDVHGQALVKMLLTLAPVKACYGGGYAGDGVYVWSATHPENGSIYLGHDKQELASIIEALINFDTMVPPLIVGAPKVNKKVLEKMKKELDASKNKAHDVHVTATFSEPVGWAASASKKYAVKKPQKSKTK